MTVFKNTNPQSIFVTVGIIVVAYFAMQRAIALYSVFELDDGTVVHATFQQMEQMHDDFKFASEYDGVENPECLHVFGKKVYCNEDEYFLNSDIPSHLLYVRFLMFMMLPIVLRHVNHGGYKWIPVYLALLGAGYISIYIIKRFLEHYS